MNKKIHLVVSIILLVGLLGFQSFGESYKKDIHPKTSSFSNWDASFIPLWSDIFLRGENFQFGPILIMFLSITCAYVFLLYNHKKEALKHEY